MTTQISKAHFSVVLCGLTCLLTACGPLDVLHIENKEGALLENASYEPTYPENLDHCWGDETQGVTHDQENWYISTRTDIYKYHVTADLAQCQYTRRTSLPIWDGDSCPGIACSCNHFGDLTFHDGYLYVPLEDCITLLEGKMKWQSIPNRLYVYDRDLNVVSSATFNENVQRKAPWASVNPLTGRIWSSSFHSSHINVYDASFENNADLHLVRRIELDREYRRIQGLAFDEHGTFYLVSDDKETPERAGIYVFTIEGNKAVLWQFIPSIGFNASFGYWEELEGITIWDVNGKDAPGITGQIHWIRLDNDAFRDDVYFKHLSVTRAPQLQ